MTKEDIRNYLEENEEVFNETIEELDSYNGYLNDSRYYSMDELSEYYNGADPIELLNRAFFGYDAETWHTDGHGEKVYGAFNPNREYFSYNGYGNLVSSDCKDYSAFLDEYFINELIENYEHLYITDSTLLEMLEAVSEA